MTKLINTAFLTGTLFLRNSLTWLGGRIFADYATDLGSGDTVTGEPGEVRDKPGSGLGYGVGVRVRSPFGPVQVDFGLNDQGDSQVHLGVGERF
ncbi:BamA/TamA family outer membrane protein [Coleofasciculus chthonoplastes]|uniref:BamA/TamA family outer membrane protein n=1 Tax=Coleofasciculus chthonoplastes TaxID=64178 RepID=UPI0022B38937|nr:BamA/TamA family outer membrane protein [Coleofasciculus chthonoplastes]